MAELKDILKEGIPQYTARDISNLEVPRYDFKTSTGELKASYFWDNASDTVKIELYNPDGTVKAGLHLTDIGLKYINGTSGINPVPFVDDTTQKLYYYDSTQTLKEIETPTGLYRVKEYYNATEFNVGWALKGTDRSLKKVIGQNALDFTTYALNVGSPYEMGARGDNSVAFQDSLVEGDNSIAMGRSTKIYSNNSISLGSNNTLRGLNSIIFGSYSSTNTAASNSIVIGNHSSSTVDQAIVIGNYLSITDPDLKISLAGALNYYSNGKLLLPNLNPIDFTHPKQIITKEYAEHIISSGGSGFTEVENNAGDKGIAPVLFLYLRPNKGEIGKHAIDASIYTGSESTGKYSASFNKSVAVGDYGFATGQSKALGNNSISLGAYSISYMDFGISLGHSAKAHKEHDIAIGANSTASGEYSICISSDDYTTSNYIPASASGYKAVAIGAASKAEKSNTVAIAGATADYQDSIMIGNGASGDYKFSVHNSLVIDRNDVVLAPKLALTAITEPRTLITKEYLDIKFQNSGQDYPGVVKVDNGIRLLAEYNHPDHVTTGQNAVDFALSTNTGGVGVGAGGDYSFAMGKGAYAQDEGTVAISIHPDHQLKATSNNKVVIGDGTPTNTAEAQNVFVITINNGYSAFEVAKSGRVYLQTSTSSTIRNAPSDKVLVTKEYIDDEFNNLQTLGVTGSGLNYLQDRDGNYTYYYLNGYYYPEQQTHRSPNVIDMSMRAPAASGLMAANSTIIGKDSYTSWTSDSSQTVIGAYSIGGHSNSTVVGANANFSSSYGVLISGAAKSFSYAHGAFIATDNRLVRVDSKVSVGDYSFWVSSAPTIGIGFGFDSNDSTYVTGQKLFIGYGQTPMIHGDENGNISIPLTSLTDILNTSNPLIAATKEYADYKMGALRVDNDFTANAGQTVFNVSYDVNKINVFYNGGKLRNGVDYTATTGTSIELSFPATLNAWVQVVTW